MLQEDLQHPSESMKVKNKLVKLPFYNGFPFRCICSFLKFAAVVGDQVDEKPMVTELHLIKTIFTYLQLSRQ
jgi:hypothetical protein